MKEILEEYLRIGDQLERIRDGKNTTDKQPRKRANSNAEEDEEDEEEGGDANNEEEDEEEEPEDIEALERRYQELRALVEKHKLMDLHRKIERAIHSLRCPPGDSPVDDLSGGERRRYPLSLYTES